VSVALFAGAFVVRARGGHQQLNTHTHTPSGHSNAALQSRTPTEYAPCMHEEPSCTTRACGWLDVHDPRVWRLEHYTMRMRAGNDEMPSRTRSELGSTRRLVSAAGHATSTRDRLKSLPKWRVVSVAGKETPTSDWLKRQPKWMLWVYHGHRIGSLSSPSFVSRCDQSKSSAHWKCATRPTSHRVDARNGGRSSDIRSRHCLRLR